MTNTDKILEIGIKAAFESGRILRFYLGNLSEINKKGETDLVTKADIESEKIITETIRAVYPDHSILAEEGGLTANDTSIAQANRWIIDPLDGTTNFAHQLPLFCCSIAFQHKNEIIAGIVFNPVTNELFTAVKNGGAYLNGAKIKVSDKNDLKESLLVTGFPYDTKDIIDPIIKRLSNCLKAAQGIRRLGSAALDLCYIACGRFDGFWEQKLKPWDTAAGYLIASEAGGVVTDFANKPFQTEMDELLATNGLIHNQMLSMIRI